MNRFFKGGHSLYFDGDAFMRRRWVDLIMKDWEQIEDVDERTPGLLMHGTVYRKGGEVVRMYQTLFGRDGFRKGMDLYFERHDGQAVTCDDFRMAMADANGRDLAQFERWYSQAGTPRVQVTTHYDESAEQFSVTLAQDYAKAAPAAQETQKGPLHIPFAIGLIGGNGADLQLELEGEDVAEGTTRILELTETQQTFTFLNVPVKPLPSLLRNFSSPVIVEYGYSNEELAFLLAHDSDPFNRWEAGQRLAARELLSLATAAQANRPLRISDGVTEAYRRVLTDSSLSPSFRELTLVLPPETYLAEQMNESDPAAVHAARIFMRRELASALKLEWMTAYEDNLTFGTYEPTSEAAGRRGLKNLALSYLAELEEPADALRLARQQYISANNMTDRSAALAVLMNVSAVSGEDVAKQALEEFYTRFEKEPLVIDKWFSFQAMQRGSWLFPRRSSRQSKLSWPAQRDALSMSRRMLPGDSSPVGSRAAFRCSLMRPTAQPPAAPAPLSVSGWRSAHACVDDTVVPNDCCTLIRAAWSEDGVRLEWVVVETRFRRPRNRRRGPASRMTAMRRAAAARRMYGERRLCPITVRRWTTCGRRTSTRRRTGSIKQKRVIAVAFVELRRKLDKRCGVSVSRT